MNESITIPQEFLEFADFNVANRTEGEKRPTFELKHRPTGRVFEVQYHPNQDNVIALMDNGAHAGKWFVSEYRPNGRLCTPYAQFFCDVVDEQWDKVRETPSKAFLVLRKAQEEAPGFEPVLSGRGYGVNSIFYPNPKTVMQAVNNAIDADMWLQSLDLPKKAFLPSFPHTEIDLKARNLIDGSLPPKLSQALEKITAAMSPTERCEISESVSCGLRIEVIDSDRQDPHNKRLLVFCDLEGNFLANAGFVRTGFAWIGDALTGGILPRYDDPSMYATQTIPCYGQGYGEPPAPPPNSWSVHRALWNCEDKHDKIYLMLRRGPLWAACWGKRDANTLQVKNYQQHEALAKINEKLNNGYFQISTMLIPDIAKTLQANGFTTDLAPEPPRISELAPESCGVLCGSLIKDGPPQMEELREALQEALRRIPKVEWSTSLQLENMSKDLSAVLKAQSGLRSQEECASEITM